jgi:hypothetical protein
MRKLTDEDVGFYQPLQFDDPMLTKKAVAYTLTPMEGEPGWDEVMYYADPNAKYDVSPLEVMLGEWNTQKDYLMQNSTYENDI